MKKYESVIDSIFLSNNGEIDLLMGQPRLEDLPTQFKLPSNVVRQFWMY